MTDGYFRSVSGRKSSSRVIAALVIVMALVFAQEVIYFGRGSVVQAAAAAGTIFITIGGPAMAFLFMQKKNEIEVQKVENINAAGNETPKENT